jgi:hypothetical protein
MLLVKDAVYFDLNAINDGRYRARHDNHIHVVTQSRIGVAHKLAVNQRERSKRRKEEEREEEERKNKRKQERKPTSGSVSMIGCGS